jgi:ADP-ribose pyrophosphatase YjhB (NUDIX family)
MADSTPISSLLTLAARLGHRVLVCYHWLVRPVTVGVKTLLVNDKSEILLVRHTYRPGWHIPGGKLDRGETVAQAAARELLEEVGLKGVADPKNIIGVFSNPLQYKHDHVVLFRVKEWEHGPLRPRAWEIAEAKFFPLAQLPEGVSPGTRRRIEEFQGKRVPDYRW